MNDLHPSPTPAQEAALELLRSAGSAVLVGHVRPDGDCLGSQAALAGVLARLGKRVHILNPDPPGPGFERLGELTPFETFDGGRLPEHEVAIFLDINDPARCGSLEGPLRESPSAKLVVDHHVFHGAPWWDAEFVDVSASATGLLVARMADALGVPLEGVVAEAIFTALVTDTGWFKYSNTDSETMALAARLVAGGVVPNALYERLYQRNPAGLPGAIASVLRGLEYFCDGRLAVIEHPIPARGGALLEDADPVLDIVRAVGSVEVVLYVRELEDGRCKLSARSKTDFDVNALARRFGGGGHKKASGATIEGSLPEVRARLVDAATSMLARSGKARG